MENDKASAGRMKILLNTPLTSIPAGVSNHYLGLSPYFSEDVIYNEYIPGHYITQRIKLTVLATSLRFVLIGFDVVKFLINIVRYKRPHVLLNTSFGHSALKRDAIHLRLAKIFGCKVAVFIHGWNNDYLQRVLSGEERFDPAWQKADAFFVLGKEFKNHLEKLKIYAPIHLTTTKVNDCLIERIPARKNLGKEIQLLFLARIEKSKGIIVAIDTFEILCRKQSGLKMLIVGTGSWLDQAKKYVAQKDLDNVTFTGALYGKEIRRAYLTSDLYILPTTHGEGMPTSVLEAMAFGLPVITRPVGGLIDFFQNGEMGYLIDSLDPSDYANAITRIINDTSLFNSISLNNQVYARDNFLASKVAFNMEASIKMI